MRTREGLVVGHLQLSSAVLIDVTPLAGNVKQLLQLGCAVDVSLMAWTGLKSIMVYDRYSDAMCSMAIMQVHDAFILDMKMKTSPAEIYN